MNPEWSRAPGSVKPEFISQARKRLDQDKSFNTRSIIKDVLASYNILVSPFCTIPRFQITSHLVIDQPAYQQAGLFTYQLIN